ncbi:MAG: discoidin domain-containing protein, partial [Armatimonadota bacterium]
GEALRAYAATNEDGYRDKDSLRFKGVADQVVGPVAQALTLQKKTDYVLVAALKSDGTLKPAVRVVGPDGPVAVVVSDGTKTWKTFSARFNSGEATGFALEAAGDVGLISNGPGIKGVSGIDAVQVYLPNEVPTEVKTEDAFVAPGPNVAVGKPYTLSPAPSYGLCADAGDATQLTDGVNSVGYFWAQKTTVGWSGANPVIITLDLGKIEPIAGMSYDTAAGVAGVAWPTNILVMTSDDGKTWGTAGDLISMATKTSAPPPASPYQVHRFATDQMKTHGRFVKLYIEQTPYCFVDEIEVFQGAQALLQEPLGKTVDDPLKLFTDRIVYNGVLWRLRSDLDTARRAIAESKLPEAQKAALHEQAAELVKLVEATPTEIPRNFRTIIPFNETHAKILALYAPLQRARGLAPLTVWTNSRWDMLAPTEAPQKPVATPSLAVDMMPREYRGATFNLTNTTDNALSVTFNLSGLPGGVNPSYVSVREVPFTDTRDRVPIADALPEIRQGGRGYRVSVPAGMTRQVWLDFRPMDVKPGDYQGSIALRSAGAGSPVTIPLALHLSPVAFPARPSIHIGGWDYLETLNGQYDAIPSNTPDFLKVLPANYVETPWATSGAQPTGGTYDPDGRLSGDLNFTSWDRWIGLWPGARLYAVFLSVPDEFAGEPMGTPRFNKMVGDWMTAWVAHMKTQGLKPEQLVLLLWDEPNEGDLSKNETIKQWAKAIKAVQPEVVLFEDPTLAKPQELKDGFWDDVDIICPNLPMFLGADQAFRDFYLNMQKAGKTMWFYSCSGPSKLLDPIAYHRSQFWYAARYGFQGSFYWAFGDEAGGSSWNAYLQKRAQYSPLFVDPSGVTDAKHMAAIREGAQDFEYFVLLKAQIAELQKKGVRTPLVEQAKTLLVQGPASVCDQITAENLMWNVPKDRDMMDKVRVSVLDMLKKLSKL